ncbi:hypothetical protein PGT21_030884 [Puccinia graminis f. sp. tritici]|uniref:Uncharacterized protein n=1 Tax=Puccinia graminis f. sp. tritici TaxID=56615 RepID=A0A5B0NDN3_PUCGR|nr:hypothetical protein PGT21_030884 [Puccinia graminis f. sp. tritici]
MTLASLGRRSWTIGGRITTGRWMSTSEAHQPTTRTYNNLNQKTGVEQAIVSRTTRNERSGKQETLKTGSRRSSKNNSIATNNNNNNKPARTYPIRKQFIFESYIDLFTSNQLCLLFRHQGLTSREWNSIRGKIKNLSSTTSSSSSKETTGIPFGEYKFDPQELKNESLPRLQVLRTKMIVPVLKSLLKQSMIRRETYDSIIYSAGSPSPKVSSDPTGSQSGSPNKDEKKRQKKEKKNLNGSLFSLSQADFNPTQLKQVLQIIAAHAPDPIQSATKKSSQSDPTQQGTEKIKFLIGFVDASICKDAADLDRFSSLNSLDTSRSQIISIISRFGSDLLSTLNQARASQLVHTLKGFHKTLEDQARLDQSPTPSQPSSAEKPTPTE